MELKYIPKNSGYIIDRKLNNADTVLKNSCFKTKGNLSITEIVPEKERHKREHNSLYV